MIARDRIAALRAAARRTASSSCTRAPAALAEQAHEPLLAGVPMPWMTRWPGPFPLLVERGSGARFTDVDGLEYVDLCLGDTGAMTGHALPQVDEAIAERARRGHHHDAARRRTRSGSARSWPAASGCRRGSWRCRRPTRTGSCCASPAHLTGRPRIAVMDWCYHGTVDETLAVLDGDRGRARARAPSARRSTSPRPPRWCRSTTSTRSTGRLAAGRRRLPADGAGAHQHRDRAARARLPRRASARSPGGTACCWSSTRRTRCAPGPAAATARVGPRAGPAWWSASRSAAASRARRTA